MVRHLSRVAVAFGLVLLVSAVSLGRQWSDRSGKHRVEATLVDVDGDTVRLKKPDGKLVTLSLAQLSEADRDFLAAEGKKAGKQKNLADKAKAAKAEKGTSALPADVKTAEALEALAKRQTTIAAVLALYQLFLDDTHIDLAEKQLAEQRLAHWQDLGAGDAVRIGDKWLTIADLEKMRDEEARLVREALKLLEAGSGDLAEAKLVAASRGNPVGVTASFLLGLYQSMIKRSSSAAEKHFTQCVKRLKLKPSLSIDDRANLLASLNNLAIVEARQKKHAQAVKHWKEAAEVAPPPREVVQNVGRFVHLAHAAPLLGIPKDAEKSAGNLFASLASGAEGKSFSPRCGWLYMSVFEDNAKPSDEPAPKDPTQFGKDEPKAGEPIAASFGSGFVVQPGYVVTNHHVVEGADELEIHASRNQAVAYKARVIAQSPKADIALLECKDFTAAAVPFCDDPHRLATDIMVLGYPEIQAIGTKLKVVKGTVSGLPDPDALNVLQYDAATNGGSSGGPVCDQRGRAVALNEVSFQLDNKIGGGVPAAVVLKFLKAELPDFQEPAASQTALDWPQVAETVGESTVLILAPVSPAKLQAITNASPKRNDGKADSDAFEDPWCMFCHGFGQIECPVKGCSNGVVLAKRTDVVGVNPLTGARITSTGDAEVRCQTCNGQGHVKCPHCNGGVDPSVLGGVTR